MEKIMFFVIPEMTSKTFVMLYKKLPDHFKGCSGLGGIYNPLVGKAPYMYTPQICDLSVSPEEGEEGILVGEHGGVGGHHYVLWYVRLWGPQS